MRENRQQLEKNGLTGPLIWDKWTRDLGGLWAITPDLGLRRDSTQGSTFKPGRLHICWPKL